MHQYATPAPQPLRSGGPSFAAMAAFYFLAARDVFSGPISLYSSRYGLGFVWFVPDIILTLILIYFVLYYISTRKNISITLVILAVSGYGCLGFIHGDSALAVISGIKMVLPFVAGLVLGEFKPCILSSKVISGLLLIASCSGVILSKFVAFPWVGTVLENAGVYRLAANQRWMDGLPRLSGFGTDNTSAGFMILSMTIIWFANSGIVLRTLFFIFSSASIYLTTSRTTLVALFVGYLGFYFADRKNQGLLRNGFIVWFCLAAFVPLVDPLIFGDMNFNSLLHSPFRSLIERVKTSWVLPVDFVIQNFPTSLATGLGLGMVDYPIQFTRFFSSDYNSPSGVMMSVDNFFLGFFLMTGVPGLLFLVFRAREIYASYSASDIVIIIVLTMVGTTVAGFGQPSFCFLTGLMLSPMCLPQFRPKKGRISTSGILASESVRILGSREASALQQLL